MKIFILEDDELISANFERIILENFDAHISQSYNLKDFSTKYVDDDFDLKIVTHTDHSVSPGSSSQGDAPGSGEYFKWAEGRSSFADFGEIVAGTYSYR